MLNTLQSLRGIFAIMIFLSHFAVNEAGGRAFYPGGTMGVEYFIVLSGFVLCLGYEKVIVGHTISYGNFIKRRIIRIYPMHLACLAAWAVVNAGWVTYEPLAIITNIFLVQAWVPDEFVYYGCNTASWCLSAFLFFYLMYPLLISLYMRWQRLFTATFALAMVVYFVFLCRFPLDAGENGTAYYTRVLPLTRLLDFTLGIMLWHVYTRIRGGKFHKHVKAISPMSKTILEITPLALYAAVGAVADDIPMKWCSQAIWWVPATATVLTFALMDREGGAVSRALSWSWLVVFGNASFCFYLMHLPAIAGINRAANFMGMHMPVPVSLAVCLVLTVIASVLVSRYIDVPLGRWLKRRLCA